MTSLLSFVVSNRVANLLRKVSAYSTQSDKLINAGEGGFVTTDDEEILAKAIYMAGCYERRYGEERTRTIPSWCVGPMGS